MIKRAAKAGILPAFLALGIFLCLATLGHAAGEKGTDYEWSTKLDCSLCHQKEVDSLKSSAVATQNDVVDVSKTAETASAPIRENNHTDDINGYAVMHAETLGLVCTDCHADSDGLNSGHKKLNSGKESKRLKKSEVANEACTSCHEIERLEKATASYKGIIDNNGTVVNPHALPASESHDNIHCTDCHEAHSGKTIDETGVGTCISCHHAGVFECNTCH